MAITPSPALAQIGQGLAEDVSQIHDELAWIESRAFDLGNTAGQTASGPLTVPSLNVNGATVNPQSFFYFGTDTGTVNALSVTTPFPNAMAKGLVLAVKVGNTNTASASLNVNGLGAYAILQGSNQLSGGELTAAGWVLLEFDGSYWNVLGMAPGGNPNGTFGVNTLNATTVNATTWTGEWASMPSGTQSPFFQAAAPPGWTQNTTVNDQVLRVVSGAGGGTGGNWSVNGFSFGAHSHTMADHSHIVPVGNNNAQDYFSFQWGQTGSYNGTEGLGGGNNGNGPLGLSSPMSEASGYPQTGGTSGSVTNDGSWRPAYINVIVCSKN